MERKTIADKMFNLCDAYEQEALGLLSALCSVDCGTGNVEGNAKIVEILCNFFNQNGISVETVDAGELGKHVVARIVPEKPKGKIIFNAHIDTVFKPGDVEKNPVYVDEDGWLHGCGTSDCKGGVVISAYAIKIAKELGLLPEYEFALIYNCDEEIGSPSGQILFTEEAKNADCVYAFEPSRDEDGILTSRMGCASCFIEVFGKQAHPAMYWNGASAYECLVKLSARLYERMGKMNNIYFNIAGVESGRVGIMSPYASAHISFRVNDDNPFEQTKAILEEVFSDVPVEGCSVKYDISCTFPQMSRDPINVKMFEHMSGIGKEYMDWDLPEMGTYGSGDACFFSMLGIPSVCGLGTYMANAHTLEEKCRVDSLKKRMALMALTIAMFEDKIIK